MGRVATLVHNASYVGRTACKNLCSGLPFNLSPLPSSGLPEVLQGDEVPGGVEGMRVYRPPFEEFEIQTVTVRAWRGGSLDET